MIDITLDDGTALSLPEGSSGADLASHRATKDAKKAVAVFINGHLADLGESLTDQARIRFVSRSDPEALPLIRHDCAHVLAQAVQELFPGTGVGIGPAIDNGFYYDFLAEKPFATEDLPKIEARMRQIIAQNLPFTREVWSRGEAIAYFAERGETLKVELVESIPADEPLSVYRQGDWLDLCRGPHGPHTGVIGNAFTLMKVAGAYWRGDSNRPMLSRIYGTAFADKKDLSAYLEQIKEAERRDHRRLGKEMDLFHFMPEEAPGSVFWHAGGWTLFQEMIAYLRRRQNRAGYFEVNSPDMMSKSLWETSGHWDKYRENMFITQTEDERTFALKPMNCPGHIKIFDQKIRSYRELPLKITEFGRVHRYEPSGALHGLMRVRSFTQDDAHIFVDEDQIVDACIDVHKLILSVYEDFGFNDISVFLSTRPEKRVGDDAIWDKAEASLHKALEMTATKHKVNPGDGAFYGPKLDYVLRDAIGRLWQCGTVQVDLNLPGRLGASYIDRLGNKKTPVMLHRALFGSLERFLGILIEHYAGALPLWLAPQQVAVCPITSAQDAYAREVAQRLQDQNIRAVADLRNEKITYKVRDNHARKVVQIWAVGAREQESRQVSVRRLGSKAQTVSPLDDAIHDIRREARPPDARP